VKVEARYCDACGVKIVGDELREGEAVQMDESVFYCKDCKAKHAPAPKASAAEKPQGSGSRTGSKRISSSRRLIARRLASGRLARSKAKVPAAVTGSGEDLRKAPLKPSGEPLPKGDSDKKNKKKGDERARVRDRLAVAKKKASSIAIAVPKVEGEIKKAAPPAAAPGDAPAAPKKAKKKKKKKAKKDGARDGAKAEKKAGAEAPLEPGKSEASGPATSEPETAKEKPAASKAEESAPATSKAEEAPGKKDSAPAASETVAASDVDGKVDGKGAGKSDAKPAASESEVAAKATKPAGSEPEDILEIISEDEKETASKATVVAKKTRKDDSGEGVAAKKKTRKDGDGDGDEDDDRDSKKKTVADRTTGVADKATRPDTRDAKGKKKSPSSDDAAEDDARATRGTKPRPKKTTLGKRTASGAGVETAEAPKKPALPLVPLLAIGAMVLLLLGVLGFMAVNPTPPPKVAERDPKDYIDDMKRFVESKAGDPDEVAARWRGISDAIPDGEAHNEALQEAGTAHGALDHDAKAAWDDTSGRVERMMSSQPGEFDAALAELGKFPPKLRASQIWSQKGTPRIAEILKRRAAWREGDALLREAKHSWETDKDADVVAGLFAAYSEEHKQTDEGKAIAEEFKKLTADAVNRGLEASSAKNAKDREAREGELWKKACADRQKLVDAAGSKEQKELGADKFEWQVRPDMLNREPIKDAYFLSGGTLTIKNSSSDPIYLGKNKRDWNHVTIEFKIKVKKGTKAWFLGKVVGIVAPGQGHVSDYGWDKLPICNCTGESDKKPHFFQGIPEDEWVTLQYRYLGKEYDVVVDGKDVFKTRVQEGRGGAAGGFGFMVSSGSVEIKDVKARVISRRAPSGEDSEE
jgi:hypothetical protein